MKLKKAIKILKEYNQWRRGSEIIEMPDPKTIGIAIDVVINEYETNKRT